jgi:tetratricopeptide (TPR) repeat protein
MRYLNIKIQFFFLLFIVACTGAAEAFLEKAKPLMEAGKPKDALPYLNQAIEKDPTNARAFNMRGAAYFELKDYTNANLDFEKAIVLDTSLYLPYFNRATMLMEQQNWEAAIADLTKAIEIQGDTSESYVKRGIALAALKQPEKAIADFNKAISLKPKDANAFYNRGNINYQLKKFEPAIADFKAAVQADSKFGKAFYALGVTYLQLNKKEEGCLYLQQAQNLVYPDAKATLEQVCK